MSNSLCVCVCVCVCYMLFTTFYFNFLLIIYFTLQYCICFESTMSVHVFSILNPPLTSLPIPSLWVIPVHQPQAPCIMHQTRTGDSFTYDNLHVSMPFSHIIPPSPSPTESKRLCKRLCYASVSLLLSRIQGYHYHLSKFHIYALVY